MNLLPEQYKNDLRLEAWRRFLIFFGSYLAVVGLIAIMLLLPSYFILRLQIDTLERTLHVLEQGDDYKKTVLGERQVEEINRSLGNLIAFEQAAPKVSKSIEDLLGRVPAGVTLQSFSYTKKGTGIISAQISGKAPRRDLLFSFVEELQKSPFVKEKITPVTTDLLKETDLTFTLLFNVSQPTP